MKIHPTSSVPTHPTVREIAWSTPLTWLALAWKDMERCGWVSYLHGLVLAILGFVIAAIAHDRFWLLAGAFSGFLVIAPILATGLYALSRELSNQRTADWRVVVKTWTGFRSGDHGKPRDWRLVHFGLLLALAGTGWVLTSAAFITLFSPQAVTKPVDFLRFIVMGKDHMIFEMWLALGGVMAAPLFASSAIAIPLMLDRQISVLQAVLTSWQAVIVNPVPMAFWAFLVMGFTLLGLGSALLGLIAVIPMLGHASWYAYRDLVVPPSQGLPTTGAAEKN